MPTTNKRLTTVATMWAYVQSWVARGLSLLLFLALARVLQPEDFGAFQAAAIVLLLSEILVEQGLGLAIIQREALDDSHLNTAFWATLALGVFLMCGAVGVSYPLAAYLRNAMIAKLIISLSPVFVIGALASVPTNLMRRALDYKVLTKRSLLANVVAGGVALVAALKGYGAWTFVLHQLTFQSVGLLVLWRHEKWRPKFLFSRSHFFDLFQFSGKVVLSKFIDYAEGRTVELYIGRVLGVSWLGQYSFGARSSQAGGQLLAAPIWDSSMGILSRFQSNDAEFKKNALLLLTLAVAISLPPFAYIIVAAPDLVPEVFGKKWTGGINCLQILMLLTLMRAPLYLLGVALQAKGRSGISLRFNIIRITGVALFLIFVKPHGIGMVAAALVVGQFLAGIYIVVSTRRFLGIKVVEMLMSCRSHFLAAPFGIGALWAVLHFYRIGGWREILLSLVAYFGVLGPLLFKPALAAARGFKNAPAEKKSSIVKLIGAFDERNFGDDLLLAVSAKLARNIQPDVQLLITVPNPKNDSYVLRLVPGSRLVERFFPIPHPCDVQVYSGGNQFYSFPVAEVRHRKRMTLLARFLLRVKSEGLMHMTWRVIKKPMVPKPISYAIGVGIGPFDDGNENDSRRVISGIRRIWIRDTKSVQYLEKWGLTNYDYGVDICFASQVIALPQVQASGGVRSIGIVTRGWRFKTGGTGYEHKVLELATDLCAKGYQVRFYSFCEPVDKGINEFFQQRGFVVETWDPDHQTVEVYLAALQREDLLISARFHGVVAGALLGIPCLGMSLDPKVDQICQQLGVSDYIWHSETSADILVKMVYQAVHNYDDIKFVFAEKSKAMCTKADQMIDDFVTFLNLNA